MKGYKIAKDGQSILCYTCARASFHPEDIKNKYCGYCHKFHVAEEEEETEADTLNWLEEVFNG